MVVLSYEFVYFCFVCFLIVLYPNGKRLYSKACFDNSLDDFLLPRVGKRLEATGTHHLHQLRDGAIVQETVVRFNEHGDHVALVVRVAHVRLQLGTEVEEVLLAETNVGRVVESARPAALGKVAARVREYTCAGSKEMAEILVVSNRAVLGAGEKNGVEAPAKARDNGTEAAPRGAAKVSKEDDDRDRPQNDGQNVCGECVDLVPEPRDVFPPSQNGGVRD